MRSTAPSRLMRYYNSYFGTRYPLPKLDLIAVPGRFRRRDGRCMARISRSRGIGRSSSGGLTSTARPATGCGFLHQAGLLVSRRPPIVPRRGAAFAGLLPGPVAAGPFDRQGDARAADPNAAPNPYKMKDTRSSTAWRCWRSPATRRPTHTAP